MTDFFIYDAVITPRGKGKKNGSLHEVTGVELATQVLNNIKDRMEMLRRITLDDAFIIKFNEQTPIQGDIEFKNVSFTYPKTEKHAIKNINISIKKSLNCCVIIEYSY